MWIWVLVTGLLGLATLFLFLLYRQTKAALLQYVDGQEPLAVEEVAALLQELEDTGEAIVLRLEAKKQEIDNLTRLLDAKMEAIQMALLAQSSPNLSPGSDIISPSATAESKSAAPLAKHNTIKQFVEQGFDPVQIARQTGLDLDEIRLIVNLLTAESKAAAQH